MQKKNSRPFKAAKMRAVEALRNSKAFVVYAFDYKDDLKVMSETSRLTDDSCIKSLSVKTVGNYAYKMFHRVAEFLTMEKKNNMQSEKVAAEKKKRSEELSREKS